MRKQLGLGSAVGALMGVRCWSGNRTLHLLSTFPDLATFILLVILLGAALWFERRQRPVFDRAAAMQAALTIAAAAGVIFGVAVVLLGTRLLTDPSFVVSI